MSSPRFTSTRRKSARPRWSSRAALRKLRRPPTGSLKSRRRLIPRSKSRPPARKRLCARWNACASSFSNPRPAPRNSPRPPNRCRSFRASCSNRWTASCWKTRMPSTAAQMRIVPCRLTSGTLRRNTPSRFGPSIRGSKMDKELQVVGFRIGRETFGLPISIVREIVRVPEITAVPNAPDYIEGVINLRGRIIPIVDLRKRFGQKIVEPSKKNRIVVVELGPRAFGLIVNSASEVLRIPPSEIEEPNNVFQEGELDFVTGVGKLKGRLVILLDVSKILKRGELNSIDDIARAPSSPLPANQRGDSNPRIRAILRDECPL